MKPNTRLLVRFTLENGDMKGWGYDAQFFTTSEQLYAAVKDDFETVPVNTEIHVFYDIYDDTIVAEDADSIAAEAIAWIKTVGAFK